MNENKNKRTKTCTFDEDKYRELICQALPRVIETEDEHARSLNLIAELKAKGASCSSEETALCKLFAVLISDYERRPHVVLRDDASPLDILKILMKAHNHTAKALWTIADKAMISRILNGKCSISKPVARRLSEFYNVPAGRFI